MKARKSDLVALGFLIAALVVFGLYQGLVEYRVEDPFADDGQQWTETRGYEVWMAIYESHQSGYLDHFFRFLIAGLGISVVVTVLGPFLVTILSRSRPLWWLMVACSGLAIVGLDGGVLWTHLESGILVDGGFEYGPGFYCLLVFPLLNFIGLLLIRKRTEGAGLNFQPEGVE
ncbi:hypothetical protein [Haloferula sp.]|uniref:hypothetical protein n=1 Tax=Haloferula sp. TaxID=2497595 RepID=UPI0032A0B665